MAPNLHAFVQRPLARQKVMLSFRVIAYYGLIRDSGSATERSLLFPRSAPEETAQGGNPELPQFTPQDCPSVPSPLPRRLRECKWLLLPHEQWPSPLE